MLTADERRELDPIFQSELDDLLESLEAAASRCLVERGSLNTEDFCRYFHTIKGSAVYMELPAIVEISNAMEDIFRMTNVAEQWRSMLATLTFDAVKGIQIRRKENLAPELEFLNRVQRVKSQLKKHAQALVDRRPNNSRSIGPKQIKVPLADLDGLLEAAQDFQRISQSESHEVISERAAMITRGLLSLRQVPFSNLLPRLRRLVSEAEMGLGKKVCFEVHGAAHKVDASLVAVLSTILLHLLRNALDHGVESGPERLEKGKPEQGSLSLRVNKGASALVVELIDDGRGVEPELVAEKSLSLGLRSASELEAMTSYERSMLIFEQGMSTRSTTNEYSGRGFGLDIVANEVHRRGGRIELLSRPGRGARFVMTFPLPLRWEDMLLVELNGHILGLPVAFIESIISDDQKPSVRDGLLMLGDEEFPVIGFREIDPRFGDDILRPAVMVSLNGLTVAMPVDRLVTFSGAFLHSQTDETAPWLSGIGVSKESQTIWGIDIGELARDWNAYTVPL